MYTILSEISEKLRKIHQASNDKLRQNKATKIHTASWFIRKFKQWWTFQKHKSVFGFLVADRADASNSHIRYLLGRHGQVFYKIKQKGKRNEANFAQFNTRRHKHVNQASQVPTDPKTWSAFSTKTYILIQRSRSSDAVCLKPGIPADNMYNMQLLFSYNQVMSNQNLAF